MPLAWAHAEFVKLLVSRQLGHPLDRPRAVWERYAGRVRTARYDFWWPDAAIASWRPGACLAIALPRPAVVHWGRDGWRSISEETTSETGLGYHVAALNTASAPPGTRIEFTWRWQDTGEWHGRDYAVTAAVRLDASEGDAL